MVAVPDTGRINPHFSGTLLHQVLEIIQLMEDENTSHSIDSINSAFLWDSVASGLGDNSTDGR